MTDTISCGRCHICDFPTIDNQTPARREGEYCAQCDVFRMPFSHGWGVTGDDPAVMLPCRVPGTGITVGAAIELGADSNGCPHCAEERFLGIHWPVTPAGDTSQAWVECCGSCARYTTDLAAALAIGAALGHMVGIAPVEDRTRPFIIGRPERRGDSR